MYDAHVHTTFSPDGKSGIQEYIELLAQGKLQAIGFAEHLDFLPECGAYGYLDYESYRAAVEAYREKGYSVYAGAEVDYAKRVEKDILKRLSNEHYDFTICSIHMVNGVSVSDRNIDHFFNKETFFEIVCHYYNELKEGIQVKTFDVVGHVGVFRRYLEDSFYEKDGLRAWLDELDYETARICAGSDKIIEVNSSGLFAVCKSTVPRTFFLRHYYELGGRRICMSSDAHDATQAGRGFETAFEILKAIGFKEMYLPWDKENPVILE